MKLDILKETVLSTLPGESYTQPTSSEKSNNIPVVSLEGYGTDPSKPHMRDGGDESECPVPPKQNPLVCRTLPYVSIVVDATEDTPEHTEWTFFLNGILLLSPAVNEFCVLMRTVKPNDVVLIYGPSNISIDHALALCNSIDACSCKNITINSPYCLNTGAVLFLTVGKHHPVSPFMYASVTTPIVFAWGSHLDSKSSVEYGTYLYMQLYNKFLERGLLTKEEYLALTNNQKAVTVYGQELAKRVEHSDQMV